MKFQKQETRQNDPQNSLPFLQFQNNSKGSKFSLSFRQKKNHRLEIDL